MAVQTSWPLPSSFPFQSVNCRSSSSQRQWRCSGGGLRRCTVAYNQQKQQQQLQLCPRFEIDKSVLKVEAAFSDEEFWATSLLRVRSFYDFKPSFGIEDHKKYVAKQEFEALKERVAGTREGFRRVSCINATLPLSETTSFSDDLCSSCKFSSNGEDQLVLGTLDLNQCVSLPGEITGMKPKGIGADFARAYLSNVCVAKECQRMGLGFGLVNESISLAQDWGISDLYVHVAVENEAAKNLYTKCGFVLESKEPAERARFLDRPRRLLLWLGLPHSYDW